MLHASIAAQWQADLWPTCICAASFSGSTVSHSSLSVLQTDSPWAHPWSMAAPEEDIYLPGISPSPPPSPLTLPPVNFQPQPAYSSVNHMWLITCDQIIERWFILLKNLLTFSVCLRLADSLFLQIKKKMNKTWSLLNQINLPTKTKICYDILLDICSLSCFESHSNPNTPCFHFSMFFFHVKTNVEDTYIYCIPFYI